MRMRGNRQRRYVKNEEELFASPLILDEFLFLGEKVFFAIMKQWILQLRASSACRITWECGVRMEEETSLLKYTATNGKNELPMFFIKDIDQSKPI